MPGYFKKEIKKNHIYGIDRVHIFTNIYERLFKSINHIFLSIFSKKNIFVEIFIYINKYI